MIKLLVLIAVVAFILWSLQQPYVQPHELYPLHEGNEAYLQPDL